MPNPKARAKAKRQKGNVKIQSTLNSLLTECKTPRASGTAAVAKLERLHDLLATLSSLQPSTDIIPKRTPESLTALVQTYVTDPAFKACFTDSTNTNASLVAKRPVPQGEAILKVPVKYALLDTLPDCLNVLNKYLPMSQDSSLRLTLNLLYQSTLSSSPHRAYIQALPSTFDNLLTYSPTFLSKLPTKVINTATKVLSTHITIYCMVYQTLQRVGHDFLEVFQWTNYAWGCGVVMSRQNSLSEGLGLVPVWDMVDHDFCCGSSEVVDDGGVEYVLLRGGLDEGERIRMNYGKRGNAELLLYAGFVVEKNCEDVVDLVVPIEGVLSVLKGNVLRKLGVTVLEDDGVKVVLKARYGGFEEVMKVLRVVVMTKDGLVGVMRDGLPGVGEAGVEESAKELLKNVVGDAVKFYDVLLNGRDVDEKVLILLKGEKNLLLELLLRNDVP